MTTIFKLTIYGELSSYATSETYVFSTHEKAEAFFSSWAREELKGVAEMDDELIEAELDILDMGELIEDRLDIRYDIEEVRLDPEF